MTDTIDELEDQLKTLKREVVKDKADLKRDTDELKSKEGNTKVLADLLDSFDKLVEEYKQAKVEFDAGIVEFNVFYDQQYKCSEHLGKKSKKVREIVAKADAEIDKLRVKVAKFEAASRLDETAVETTAAAAQRASEYFEFVKGRTKEIKSRFKVLNEARKLVSEAEQESGFGRAYLHFWWTFACTLGDVSGVEYRPQTCAPLPGPTCNAKGPEGGGNPVEVHKQLLWDAFMEELRRTLVLYKGTRIHRKQKHGKATRQLMRDAKSLHDHAMKQGAAQYECGKDGKGKGKDERTLLVEADDLKKELSEAWVCLQRANTLATAAKTNQEATGTKLARSRAELKEARAARDSTILERIRDEVDNNNAK